MRKLILFLIVAVFPFYVFAKEYEDQDIKIKLSLDDNYIVLTRNNLDNNNDLQKLGITKEQMQDIMNKGAIYLDIIKEDISYEILVVVPDIVLPVNNLTGISEELLASFKEEAAKKVGANISSTYKNNYDFIIVDYYDANMKYYIVNYYTVINSRGYNFQIQKKTEITENDRNELKKIVDSVEFLDFDKNNDEKKVDANAYKNNFDYKNIIYGAIIGAIAGLISYCTSIVLKKKKKAK